MELNEQEIVRRQKLEDLRKQGIDPYPAETWEVNTGSKAILEGFDADPDSFKDLSFAGRIMSIRDMGKACFALLQDDTGRMQIYVRQEDLCPGEDKSLYQQVWKKLIDIGDIIGLKDRKSTRLNSSHRT